MMYMLDVNLNDFFDRLIIITRELNIAGKDTQFGDMTAIESHIKYLKSIYNTPPHPTTRFDSSIKSSWNYVVTKLRPYNAFEEFNGNEVLKAELKAFISTKV